MEKKVKNIIIISIIILVIISIIILTFTLKSSENSENESQQAESLGSGEEETITEPVEQIEETNETLGEEIEVQLIDLSAHNLTLIEESCSLGSNGTCVMSITGKIKNLGTQQIQDNIILHFLDTSGGGEILIGTPVFNRTIAPNAIGEYNIKYENISRGSYFITFKVDGTNSIDEIDETNNQLTEFIKL